MIRAHQILEELHGPGIVTLEGAQFPEGFVDYIDQRLFESHKFDCSAINEAMLDSADLYAAGEDILKNRQDALPYETSYFEFWNAGSIAVLCCREDGPHHRGVFIYTVFKREIGWHLCHLFSHACDGQMHVKGHSQNREYLSHHAGRVTANCGTSFLCVALGVMASGKLHLREESPRAAVVARREREGRLPFFSHSIVEIDGLLSSGGSLGGTHASPRAHFRRGHERLLKSGRRVAVRHSLVGDLSKGFVSHDYKVRNRVPA